MQSSSPVLRYNKVINIDVEIGLCTWNGENYIDELLTSLSNQTHEHIKVIILDNQSTDSTPKIIQSYANKDSRFIYIRDSIQRSLVDAQRYMVQNLLSGRYNMVVCDDDVYGATFIQRALEYLLDNPSLGLYYPCHKLISNNSAKIFTSTVPALYTSNRPSWVNALLFSWHRNCVPVFFGIYRRDCLLESIRYFTLLDNLGWNHDNVFLFDFLLNNKVQASLISSDFYYRIKDREQGDLARGYKTMDGLALLHQLRILGSFCNSCFSLMRRRDNPLLLFLMLLILISNSFKYLFLLPSKKTLRTFIMSAG